MISKNKDSFREYVSVWDDGAVRHAPFITLGIEALLTEYYGNLLDAPPPFPVEEKSTVLDLGCGWGRVLKPVMERGARAIGLDISERMLDLSQEHLTRNGHTASLVRGDGTALPFRDNSFDMVYSLLVLQHLSKENGLKVLREIRRVLKPGGMAYVRVPGRFAPENMLFGFLQWISIHLLGVKDPIRMRFYRIGEIKKICETLFADHEITAHEFRPPWNFHTRWTWNYILIPKRFHRCLRRISDRIEEAANTKFKCIKHFGVVLMVRVMK